MGAACSGVGRKADGSSSSAGKRYQSSGVVGGAERTEDKPSAEQLALAARSRINPAAAEASRQSTLGRLEARAKSLGRPLPLGYRDMSEGQLHREMSKLGRKVDA
jgi:hypothetical protein